MQDIGYDSYNSLITLNTLAIVIILYILRLIIYLMIRIFIYLTCDIFCLSDRLSWFDSMFFNELHAVYKDGFMEIIIATFLTLKDGFKSQPGEIVSSSLAIFSLLVIFIIFPFSIFMIFIQKQKTLKTDENFKLDYG